MATSFNVFNNNENIEWFLLSVNDLSNKFPHAELKKNSNYLTIVMLKSVLYIYQLGFLKLRYNLTEHKIRRAHAVYFSD